MCSKPWSPCDIQTELTKCGERIKRLSNKQSTNLTHNSDVNKLVQEIVDQAKLKIES